MILILGPYHARSVASRARSAEHCARHESVKIITDFVVENLHADSSKSFTRCPGCNISDGKWLKMLHLLIILKITFRRQDVFDRTVFLGI